MSQHHFVVCVDNSEYEVSLERRKIYECAPNTEDLRNGLLRVVDESGDDYVYPADRFMAIELPKPVEEAVLGQR